MNVSKLIEPALTLKQLELKAKHGTPLEFAAACYVAVPVWISMNEADDAVAKYQQEWDDAGKVSPPVNNPGK